MSDAFIIVGGGQAAAWAAKTLRQEGFLGSVTVLSDEDHPPYERPPLSKQVLLGEAAPESTHIFPRKSYSDWNVDLRLGSRVTALSPRAHLLRLADGTQLRYDRLLLATGAAPRRLAGITGHSVFYLRSISDALDLRAALVPEARVLVVGGGWIGLEAAAAARKIGARVTLVEAGSRLCARAAPKEVSDFLLDLHRAHGVDVRLGTSVSALEGPLKSRSARLSDGETLEICCVVVGIGAAPITALAEAAGLHVEDGVAVDGRLRTSDPDIFAAGDVASRLLGDGRRSRLESWDNAQKQGAAAARAMLDRDIAHERYPWFWSDQLGANIQLLGEFNEGQERVDVPQKRAGARLILYRRGGRVEGAAGFNSGREVRQLKRSLEQGQTIPVHP